MMREFCEDILRRDPPVLTPLEKVVLWECAEQSDLQQLHEREVRQLLEDIDRRKAAAQGKEDLVTAAFHVRLERARKYQPMEKEAMQALSPRQIRQQLEAEKYASGARIYDLRRRGLTLAEITEELQLEPAEVRKTERQLLRLYKRICQDAKGATQGKPDPDRIQLVNTLLQGSYRIFRRDVTGMTEYRFYCKDRLLGTARCQVGRDFPVVIFRDGLVFNSCFDKTIVPGVTRDVIDADAPDEVVAQLRWLGQGQEQILHLHNRKDLLDVRIDTSGNSDSSRNVYTMYALGGRCAQLLPLPEKQFMRDWELIYCAKLKEGISDGSALLLLCYPLLRFAE